MRRRTMLLVSVVVGAVLLATVAGVAWAKVVECKPNKKCEGTRKADTLIGTDSSDRIFGLKGDDELFGLGAGDRLVGGKGDDTLQGGAPVIGDGDDQADDTLEGGSGEDGYRFREDWGDDLIIDTAIVDDEVFTANDVLIFSAAGAVIVNLNANPAADEVSDGINTINWDGNVIDVVRVRNSDSAIITGNSVANFIERHDISGVDVISGGDGDDIIENGDETGNDELSGEGGNDEIRNSDKSGVDTINGGEGNDEIESLGWDEGDGVNVFSGGNDIVNGGPGDDTIDVRDGFGGDVVDCGEGTDTVTYDAPDGADPGDTVFNCEVTSPG